MAVKLTLLSAGYCTHQENMAILGGRKIEIKFPALVGLIEHPVQGPVLFDTGYAGHFFDETRGFPGSIYAKVTPVFYNEEDGIARQLRNRGIQPEDVKHVIVSHFHADHVAGLKDFPNARFTCFESAYQKLKDLGKVRALLQGFLPGLLPRDFESRAIAVEQFKPIEIGERFGPFTHGVDLFGDGSVVVIELPGHALGHFGVMIDTAPVPHFLVADACWRSASIREDRPPHPLAQVIFSDRKLYRQSLRKLHLFHQRQPELVIVPSHCGEAWDALVEHVPGGSR